MSIEHRPAAHPARDAATEKTLGVFPPIPRFSRKHPKGLSSMAERALHRIEDNPY
jgi:hypothetical protein